MCLLLYFADKGNTPLHYAARAENDEAVEELLRAGSYIGHINHLGVPPLTHIKSRILENYFDEHIQSSKEHIEDFEILYDYSCFISVASQQNSPQYFSGSRKSIFTKRVSEIESLHYISQNNALRHILKHPLLSSFLYIKWNRIKHIFYLNLVCHLLFFLTLIAFIVTSNWVTEDKKNYMLKAGEEILRIIVLSLLTILALRDLIQLCYSPRKTLL